MGIWTPSTPGNLSALLTNDDAQDDAMRSCEHGSTEPTSKVPGLMWSCTRTATLSALGLSTHALLRWNGTAWEKFLPGFGGSVLIVAAGVVDVGTGRVANLGVPTSPTDAARNVDVLKKDGSVALTGSMSAGTNRITNLGAPTSDSDAARKIDCVSSERGTLSLTGTASNLVMTAVPRGAILLVRWNAGGGIDAAADEFAMIWPAVNTGKTRAATAQRNVRITACDGSGASPFNFTGLRFECLNGASPVSFPSGAACDYLIWR